MRIESAFGVFRGLKMANFGSILRIETSGAFAWITQPLRNLENYKPIQPQPCKSRWLTLIASLDMLKLALRQGKRPKSIWPWIRWNNKEFEERLKTVRAKRNVATNTTGVRCMIVIARKKTRQLIQNSFGLRRKLHPKDSERWKVKSARMIPAEHVEHQLRNYSRFRSTRPTGRKIFTTWLLICLVIQN